MSEELEILLMILMGCGGVLLVTLFQMQGINDSNPNLNWRQVVRLYFSRTWANTFASVMLVVLYSCTHEEWITFVANYAGIPMHKLVSAIIKLVMIMSFMVGGACQYGIYKVVFRRIDLAMKKFNPKKEDATAMEVKP